MALPTDLQSLIYGYLPFRLYDNYDMPLVAWHGFFAIRYNIALPVIKYFLTPYTQGDQELCRKVAYYAGESSEKAQFYMPTELVLFNAVQKFDLRTYYKLVGSVNNYNLPELTLEILRSFKFAGRFVMQHLEARRFLYLRMGSGGGSGKELLYEIWAKRIYINDVIARELSKATFEWSSLPTACFAAGYARKFGKGLEQNLKDIESKDKIYHPTSYISGYIAAGGRDRSLLQPFFAAENEAFFDISCCKAFALHNLPYPDDLDAYDDSESIILAKLGHVTLLSFFDYFVELDHLRDFPRAPDILEDAVNDEITLTLMPPLLMQDRARKMLPLITRFYRNSPLREAFLAKLNFIIAPESWTTLIDGNLALIFRRPDIGIFENIRLHHLALKFCDPLQAFPYVRSLGYRPHKMYYESDMTNALAYNAFEHHQQLAFAQLIEPYSYNENMTTLEGFRAQLASGSSRVIIENNNYLVSQLLPFLGNPRFELLRPSEDFQRVVLVANYHGRDVQIASIDNYVNYFRQRGDALPTSEEFLETTRHQHFEPM